MRRMIGIVGATVVGCSTVAPQDSMGGSSGGGEVLTSTGPPGGSTGESPTGGTTTGVEETTSDPSPPTTTDATTGRPDACGADVEPGPTIVPTTLGALEGAALPGGGIAFRGVRYAEPPVGALRFRPPSSPPCSPGVTPALAFGPVCPQVEKDAQGQVIATLGEEDCLTLNVWTPATGAGKRPVLVFLHGGGNAVGSGSDELYDGAALATGQDVVVVTLNYRLGALGFLVHPALAEEREEGVSGNYGILDQVLALQWVRDNIAGFGGDPGRVMVFGESAGAVNTCALIGSPAAAGLLQRAIVQSGACNERTLAKLSSDIAAPWVAATGCGEAMSPADCLRALSVETILTTQPDGYPNVAALGQGWGPHVDGVVLPTSTLSAMSEGTANPGAKMFGANAGETANAVPPMTVPQYEALVKSTFGPLADAVLAQYPAADYGNDGDRAYVALTSDLKFVCQARKSARAADAGQGEPVFRYQFAYDAYEAPPDTPKAAFHGLELVYVFGNWDAVLPGMFEYQPNQSDLAMSARIQAAWVRFAATGDPAGADLPWPQYVGAQDNAALLDEPPGLVQGVRTQQCDFWDSLAP